ncbi:hypothetical protein MTsPCn3_10230 [Erythrobacter sp. MTPC3]
MFAPASFFVFVWRGAGNRPDESFLRFDEVRAALADHD